MTSSDTASDLPGGTVDWRAAMLEHIRQLIKAVDPAIVEQVKWRKPSNPAGVPTWSMDGLICTGETYRDKVKLTFAHGAQLDDPSRLFNSSLDGKTRRAIDLHQGEAIDAEAFQALVKAAAGRNAGKG